MYASHMKKVKDKFADICREEKTVKKNHLTDLEENQTEPLERENSVTSKPQQKWLATD